MSFCSPAQVLPTLIIQAIAEFIQITNGPKYYSEIMPALMKKPLIPLMGVCRHWNAAVNGLFYCSAQFARGNIKVSHKDPRPFLNLDDVAAMDKLPCLRKLQLYLSAADFIRADDNPAVRLNDFLQSYGPLANVNEITLSIGYYRSTARSAGRFIHGFTMDIFETRLSDFVDCFHRLLPGKRIFNIHKSFHGLKSTLDESFTQTMTEMLPKLLGQDIRHFSFSSLTLTSQFVSSLQACALCYIKLTGSEESKQKMELVRRSCTSLEYLVLDDLSTKCVLHTIGLMVDGDKALVYPRLKELHLSSYYDDIESDETACSTNLFPALENLTCSGFTHLVLIKVIGHIRHTVRIMKLDINQRSIDWLKSHGIFKAGLFKGLATLLLNFVPRHDFPMNARTNEMFVDALNTNTVAHLALFSTYQKCIFSEDMLSRMVFSDNLRFLDIGYMHFTVCQAVRLLSGFKRLYKATLSLKEETSIRTTKTLTVKEIRQFQAKFKDQPSSVRMVQLLRTEFFTMRRAGEYIVLMADALSNVERVAVKYTHGSYALNMMNRVKSALKGSVYKNDVRLQNIDYSIVDFPSH